MLGAWDTLENLQTLQSWNLDTHTQANTYTHSFPEFQASSLSNPIPSATAIASGMRQKSAQVPGETVCLQTCFQSQQDLRKAHRELQFIGSQRARHD